MFSKLSKPDVLDLVRWVKDLKNWKIVIENSHAESFHQETPVRSEEEEEHSSSSQASTTRVGSISISLCIVFSVHTSINYKNFLTRFSRWLWLERERDKLLLSRVSNFITSDQLLRNDKNLVTRSSRWLSWDHSLHWIILLSVTQHITGTSILFTLNY